MKNLEKKGSFQAGAVPDINLALRLDYPIDCPIKLDEYGQDDKNGTLYVGNTGLANEYVCDVSAISLENRPGDLIKSDISIVVLHLLSVFNSVA